MTHVLVKSQPGSTLPLALVAEVKLACVCICAVVMPIPPAEAVCPEVVTSQKLLVTTLPPVLLPTSPPTLLVPLTWPTA